MSSLAVPAASACEGEVRPLHRVEYDRLVELGCFADERIELLEGTLVRMSPQGPRHHGCIQALLDCLFPQVGGRAKVRVQGPLAAGESSEPEPDLALVEPAAYRTEHPSAAFLVIEVAATSVRKDLVTMARIYAAAGVR